VAIGGPNADTRDPHVFWYEPAQRWVTAHFDGGTAFYTSPDLKTWTRTGHVNFGFECPDIYELPIDGASANRKWVLQDASGTYLLGQFDGATFVPDSLVTKKMDMSSNFYASQTFYRPTFPDARLVQMGWIRGLNGTTAPFNQTITFPVEVKLVTFPDGVRVARSPVTEIKNLYGTPVHFDAQVSAAGMNPFAMLSSKIFDLEVTLDLAQTTASTISFRLGSVTFPLDIAGRQLFGATVSPINGRLKIRIVRDWGQYEVFANDGQVAYTQSFAFDPSNASMSMTGNGTVAIVAADFRPLNRAWPGRAADSSLIIDDAEAGTVYAGPSSVVNEGRYFKTTAHVVASGASFQAAFTGTRVEWYGLKNTDLGYADVYLDGSTVPTTVDTYSAKRQNALLFTKGGLVRGPHTLRVVASGQRNASSTGAALVHDYVIVYVDP
jgi:Glycosyl hydrolases family 32 N-terminal domain/Glycosyl hydrolases family 32 C terminal